MSKRRFVLAAASLLALLGLLAPQATAAPSQDRPPANAGQFRRAVEVDGVVEHLEALQAIADENGGTRASGTPGYEASVDYVVERLEAAGYDPEVQEFTFPFFEQTGPSTFEQVTPIAQTYVEGTDYFLGEFSGSGDVTAALVPIDLALPPTPEPSSTSGCEPEDFAGFVAGSIALIQRGFCTFEVKVANAEAAGAAGVVLFNEGQPGRTDAFTPALGHPFAVPVVMTSFAIGNALNDQVVAGEDVTVHLLTSTQSEDRQTWNVLADTDRGRDARTVVVGAHLDSVLAGPGINDNGSGSATILEVAEELAAVANRSGRRGPTIQNQVRFAFWGAEESGLLGSEHYVSTLPEDDLADIAINLNFDMVGSPNFVRFVYDGDGSDTGTAGPAGSDRIEAAFVRFFDRMGLETEPTAFDGRSDYGPFIAVGIPAGGLFTGAEGVKTAEQAAVYGGDEGEAYDPCYHAACDTIDNVNAVVLDQMADAVAQSTWEWSHRRPPRRAAESTSDTERSTAPSGDGHLVTA